MNSLQRIILQLYPLDWRERYGAEMEALLNESRTDLAGTLNLLPAPLPTGIGERTFGGCYRADASASQ